MCAVCERFAPERDAGARADGDVGVFAGDDGFWAARRPCSGRGDAGCARRFTGAPCADDPPGRRECIGDAQPEGVGVYLLLDRGPRRPRGRGALQEGTDEAAAREDLRMV